MNVLVRHMVKRYGEGATLALIERAHARSVEPLKRLPSPAREELMQAFNRVYPKPRPSTAQIISFKPAS
jgi:hypothetical protein